MVEGPGSGRSEGGRRDDELARTSLAGFAAGCADPRGGPAAGSGSAAAAAVGAGLVSMALRCAGGERRGAVDPASLPADAPYLLGRADEADALRAQLVGLVDEDQRAYAAWCALRGAGGEKAEKARAQVVDVPFEVLERAVFCLRLAAVSAGSVSGPWACELRAGAAILHGAHLAARAVYEANLDDLAVADAAERRAELGVLAGAATEALGALGLGGLT